MSTTAYSTMAARGEEAAAPRTSSARTGVNNAVLSVIVTALVVAACVLTWNGDAFFNGGVAQVKVDSTENFLSCVDPSDQPKWAGVYEADQDRFWELCYHSFRCCSTENVGCLATEAIGAKCKGCLATNAPQQLKKTCVEYHQTHEEYRESDLLEGTPPYMVEGLAPWDQFEDQDSFLTEGGRMTDCYNKPEGAISERFAEQCWDAIDWCNMQCPRDGPTMQHEMCKHCISKGFADSMKGEVDENGDFFIPDINWDIK